MHLASPRLSTPMMLRMWRMNTTIASKTPDGTTSVSPYSLISARRLSGAEGQKGIAFQRLGNEKPLCDVAARRLEHIPILPCFHALSDACDPQATRISTLDSTMVREDGFVAQPCTNSWSILSSVKGTGQLPQTRKTGPIVVNRKPETPHT
jgi:hypothetical protein